MCDALQKSNSEFGAFCCCCCCWANVTQIYIAFLFLFYRLIIHLFWPDYFFSQNLLQKCNLCLTRFFPLFLFCSLAFSFFSAQAIALSIFFWCFALFCFALRNKSSQTLRSLCCFLASNYSICLFVQ